MEDKLVSASDLIDAIRDDPNINGSNFAKIKRHIDNMPERCVCCGEIIPEGRQVCPQCERRAEDGK